MATVQIRNLPDDVHRRLKVEAAQSGRSLNELLVSRLTELAERPTLGELAREIHGRGFGPYTGPSSAKVIRAMRDSRP
jgi:antitoxin FitA